MSNSPASFNPPLSARAEGFEQFFGRRPRLLLVDDQPVGVLVTLSIGVAVAPPSGGCEAAALVGLADEQLYRAKAEGRARVCARAWEG